MRFTFKRTIFFFSVLLLAISCVPSSSIEKADLVLKNVTLFDSKTGKTAPSQSIFISDGIITAIQPYSETDTALKIVDGENRLATPGLIDTHVHLTHQYHYNRNLINEDRERLARVYLTHGVTTIADMGQPQKWTPIIADWETRTSSLYPDIQLVAGSLNTKHDWDTNPPTHHILLESPESAKEQVRTYHTYGASRLKLYWKLEQPEMAAIIEEADELGMSYFAHIDNGFMTVEKALDNGVKDFEHFFTLQRSIVEPDQLIQEINELFPFEGPDSLDEWTLSLLLYHHVIDQNPKLKTKLFALIDKLATNNATVSTTINILASTAGASPKPSFFDPKPPRLSPLIREDFVPKEFKDTAFQSFLSHIKYAHDAGIKLRIGTDARNGGESALVEMKLLSEAGIPISEVLKIATLNGAEALNIADKVGYIAVGYNADIVLFESSPFENPDNFLKGVTTLKSGILFNPTVSLAEKVKEALLQGNFDEAKNIYSSKTNHTAHPSEFQAEIDNFIKVGNIDAARTMIDMLPDMLNGETVPNYISQDNLNQSGQDFLIAGDEKKAIDIFALGTDVFEDNWLAHFNMGAVYLSLERTEEAYPFLMKALSLDPENEIIQSTLDSLE